MFYWAQKMAGRIRIKRHFSACLLVLAAHGLVGGTAAGTAEASRRSTRREFLVLLIALHQLH